MNNRKIDWKDCCNKKIAKNVSLDLDMISSLIKSGENKIKSSDELEMNEITSSSKFILAYDSLRETLEALALKNGYKVYNHECYTAFLKEVVNYSSKADEFDDIRKIRNSVNYYGKELDVVDAKDLINKIKDLRKFIMRLLKQ